MKRDWHKNPANDYPTSRERMETQPHDKFPEWVFIFLVVVSLYLIYSYFLSWGNTEGKKALDKAQARTYQSFDDYKVFMENNK